MGKNPRKTAESLRLEQQKEEARAGELDTQAERLNDAVSGRNGQNALDQMRDANVKNAKDVVKGTVQATRRDILGQAWTATKMALRTLPGIGRMYDAAPQVADPKMAAQLEATRAAQKTAKNNAAVLGTVATAIEKKVAEPKPAAPKAADPKPAPTRVEHDGRSSRDLGRGDAKEFHGNDRAAEKASRTG